jgi:hypothetical protein
LRVGISRGRSCASVLVIPRRRTSLCEALHERCPWPELELPWEPWGACPRREGRGRGRGGRGALLVGAMGRGRGVPWGGAAKSSLTPAALRVLRFVHEKKLNVRKKRRRKENKMKRKEKEKEKNGKFSNPEYFQGEDKRQFMKLKKLFLYKKGINLIIIK